MQRKLLTLMAMSPTFPTSSEKVVRHDDGHEAPLPPAQQMTHLRGVQRGVDFGERLRPISLLHRSRLSIMDGFDPILPDVLYFASLQGVSQNPKSDLPLANIIKLSATLKPTS